MRLPDVWVGDRNVSVINLQVLIKIRNVDEVTWGKCEPEKSLGSPKCSIKAWFVNITPGNRVK